MNFYTILDLIFVESSLYLYYKLRSSNSHDTYFFNHPTDANMVWHGGYKRMQAIASLAIFIVENRRIVLPYRTLWIARSDNFYSVPNDRNIHWLRVFFFFSLHMHGLRIQYEA
jgi:hypothetical protein